MKEVTKLLPEWFANTNLSVYELYSDNENKNDETLDAFENDKSDKLHLLLCIDMLNEGVHMEGITGVIMMRPTESLNVYLQQIGRAFSASSDSIPKIYDIVDNASLLKPIRGFWKELSEAYVASHPECNEEDYEFDIEKKELEFLDVLDEFYENLYMSWDDWYAIAESYYQENGDLNVPSRYSIGEYNLGTWIYNQRKRYKHGLLSENHILKLESIGMNWDVLEMQWHEGYKHAKIYFKENGHLCVPFRYSINGFNLGSWIRTQRTNYKKNTLSADCIKKLEALGMIWVARADWEENYHYAEQFYKKNGHLNIPVNYHFNDFNLGAWIVTQRKSYKNGSLSAIRIHKLENIEMIWNPLEAQWEEKYRYAENFFKKHNHLIISPKSSNDEFGLGIWIACQRKCYKDGSLSDVRIQKLESIGMVWNVPEMKWQRGYCYAKKFFMENGHLNVSKGYIFDGYNLGNWIGTQRLNYKKKKISNKNIQKLEAIKMIWDPITVLWEEGYCYAEAFYNENGHLNVPGKYTINGYCLGGWICNQRKLYKSGKLSNEYIKRLEKLEIVWDGSNRFKLQLETKWEENYHIAKMFFKENGHLNVPEKCIINGCNLNRWIKTQRTAYKNRKISANRIQKLESIGMIWDGNEAIKLQREVLWEKNFCYAKDFFKNKKHLKVPEGYLVEGFNLGAWLANQKTLYKENKISIEHIHKLESIGMVWSVR